MYKIVYTNRMKKDAKLMKRCGKDLDKHDFRECHIEPDWLLLYQIYEDTLILSATATGSHADLFGK